MKKSAKFLLLTMLLGGCAQDQAHFRNDFYNYEFNYPQVWTIKTSTAYTDVIAPKNNSHEKGTAILSISSEEVSGRSFEECYKIYVEDWYKEQFDGLLKAEGSTMLKGKSAKWMEYQYEQGGTSITQLVYIVYCDDRFFLINGMSSTKLYPIYKSKFEVVIKSFTTE